MFVRVGLILVAVAFVVAVAARQSSGAAPAERYVVRPGDTLWSIAASHYAGDPREAIPQIENRNELTGPSIQPGQRLVLPSG
jgi:polar amino acid transport system substrate-binding protein